MRYTLTLLESDFEKLREIILSAPGFEGAAYLLCGRSVSERECRLLVRAVLPVQEKHYRVREPLRLSIASDSFVPVAKRAAESNASVVFVHSHPEGMPDFSNQDNQEEPKLLEFFDRRIPGVPHGAMVVSSEGTVCGRIRIARGWSPVERVRIVGRRFHFLDRRNSASDDPIPVFFDRQVRAFGPELQRLLSRLHIGVVGAGGTGSAVIEQLTRLGIGQLSVFDFDKFDTTNVNRVYGSTAKDGDVPKVELARRLVETIGLSTVIKLFEKGVCVESDATGLRDCDVIFSCTDKHAPRGVVTQVAVRYLIPMIDMGAIVESENGKIEGIYGRITTFFPGEACLFCRRRIDSDTIRLEGLPKSERDRLIQEGYAKELETNAPAVIPFTTAVAAQAVNEFLHRLSGFMGSDRLSTEILFRFHDTAIGRNREKPKDDCFCSQQRLWGKGDSKRFLDISWPSEPTPT